MVDIPATVEAEMVQEKGYDASDPEQVNVARKQAGSNRKARLEFVEAMLRLPQGRKWLWEFMKKCFVYGNPVRDGDTHMTYFNLGMQNAGKMLLADTQEFPELYAEMAKEGRENK